jgi:hypothetical protein
MTAIELKSHFAVWETLLQGFAQLASAFFNGTVRRCFRRAKASKVGSYGSNRAFSTATHFGYFSPLEGPTKYHITDQLMLRR